jgi:hypothetical protein
MRAERPAQTPGGATAAARLLDRRRERRRQVDRRPPLWLAEIEVDAAMTEDDLEGRMTEAFSL